MRIDNPGNLPHPHSKKNEKTLKTIRPHEPTLYLIGISHFPTCLLRLNLQLRRVSLCLYTPIHAVIRSPLCPLFWRLNKRSSCRLSPDVTYSSPPILVALAGLSTACQCLSSTSEAETGCSTQMSPHKCQTEHPGFTLTNTARLSVMNQVLQKKWQKMRDVYFVWVPHTGSPVSSILAVQV